MKKILASFLIALFACFMMAVLIPGAHSQVNEPQNIHIGSHSYYIDSLGNLMVIGEVQNVGSDVIDKVILTGSAFTVDGLESGSYCQAWVFQLLPQQKAPFYMEFYPPQDANGWYSIGDISLNVAEAKATTWYQYQDLTIIGASATIGNTAGYNGAYMVSGTIKNTGSQAATNITVVGTFFNSTGIPIGAGYTTYLSPRTLNPGESTSFQVAALDLNQSIVPSSLKITSYSLLVQTEQPLLEGNAPQATPYTGSGTSDTPQPGTDTSGGSTTLIFGAVAAVVIIVVAVAFLFLRKRSQPAIAPTSKPTYKPKPTKRNRK
jgi:hypothetical protein